MAPLRPPPHNTTHCVREPRMFSCGAHPRDPGDDQTPMMCTTRFPGATRRIQGTRQVHWSGSLRPRRAKNALRDCTRHTVRPGPTNAPHRGEEPDGARDRQTTAQSPSSVPFGLGAPLKGLNVNATAKRSATHRYAPGRWDVQPIARVRPEHRQGEPAHCAANRAHPHSLAARPSLCPDQVGRRAQRGGRQEPDEPHIH